MTLERERNAASDDQHGGFVRMCLGLLLAVAVLALCNPALAQRTTGSLQTTQTTSAGTWNLPSILPGKYTVSMEAPGFKSLVKKDVTVMADRENVADAQLQLGIASETIEVTAGTEQIQTTSSTLNNNFDSQALLNLPVVGGALSSPLNLAILAPNVVAQPGGVTGIGGSVGGTTDAAVVTVWAAAAAATTTRDAPTPSLPDIRTVSLEVCNDNFGQHSGRAARGRHPTAFEARWGRSSAVRRSSAR